MFYTEYLQMGVQVIRPGQISPIGGNDRKLIYHYGASTSYKYNVISTKRFMLI